MKHAGFLIVFVVLLMMGCSKTEQFPEDNQLKSGRVIKSIYFYATSNGLEFWPLELTETFDGKILKDGSFSGSFGTYGKINSILSTYKFSQPGIVPNPEYYIIPNYQHCKNNYLIDFTDAKATIYIVPFGKASTTTSGSCTMVFTTGHNPLINLWTEKWGPGNTRYGEEYYAGFFNGTVKITEASGVLSTLVNRKFSVYRINIYGINLSSGQVNLVFREIM